MNSSFTKLALFALCIVSSLAQADQLTEARIYKRSIYCDSNGQPSLVLSIEAADGATHDVTLEINNAGSVLAQDSETSMIIGYSKIGKLKAFCKNHRTGKTNMRAESAVSLAKGLQVLAGTSVVTTTREWTSPMIGGNPMFWSLGGPMQMRTGLFATQFVINGQASPIMRFRK